MKRKGTLILTALILMFSLSLNLGLNHVKVSVEASNGFPVHNLNTRLNYTSIQEAIDANETLDTHTIFVEEGTYFEHVIVDKSLSLIGENMTNTIIDGSGTGLAIVEVKAGNVIVSNFSITNSSGRGVYIHSSTTNPTNVTIQRNRITHTEAAILILGQYPERTSGHQILENDLSNNTVGIKIEWTAMNNTVFGNTITFNELGVRLEGGNNNLSSNVVEKNFFGIDITSQNNTLRQNDMNDNQFNFNTLGRFYMLGFMPSNDIDTSNRVNGKNVYYYENEADLTIDPATHPRIGFLGLKNCSNITVSNLTLTNNYAGILLSESVNTTIKNCKLQNNVIGASIYANQISVIENTISGNLQGIEITGYFNNVTGNTITNNTFRFLPYRYPDNWSQWSTRHLRDWIDWLLWYSSGILLFQLDNSTISNNDITANEHGILIFASSFNIFRNNSMAGNVYDFGIDPQQLIPIEWAITPPESPQFSPYLCHDIDTSNNVNGKPIYYWMSKQNQEVPSNAGYVALINCTDVVVKDLVLSSNYQGVFLVWVNNTTVSNNTITDTRYGIYLRNQWSQWGQSNNNTLSQNYLTKNGIGIISYRTSYSTISNNFVASNLFGIFLGDSDFVSGNTVINHTKPADDSWLLGYYPPHFNIEWLRLWVTSEVPPDGVAGMSVIGENSTLQGNLISNNSVGLLLGSYEYRSGRLNRILENSIIGNTHGINLGYHDNTIFHNNFINNSEQIYVNPHIIGHVPADYFVNVWDNGYEGNYWSDYNGYDSDHDGISDTSHPIPGVNTDHYPLMGMFSSWSATSEFNIQAISNSTISNFEYNGTAISFNVVGENGTTGFSRMCIPRALMNETYRVFVNGTEVSYDPLPVSNSTHSYLYFTYEHSTKEVVIVPEFPSLIVISLLMTGTLLVAVASRRKNCMRPRDMNKRMHTFSIWSLSADDFQTIRNGSKAD